jgi:hypothetical protein
MTHDYIAQKYERGQDDESRRAIAAEIIREHTPEGEAPTYVPTAAEIDAVETEYYAARRKAKYGTWESQLEEIYDTSLTAWKARIAGIKSDIPKE